VAQLQRRFPPLTVTWLPRELTVVVQDDLLVLPASRQRREALLRVATGAAPYTVVTSGPFAAFTFNALGRELWQGGYSWKGTTWTVSVVPSSILYATYTGGPTPQAAARVAVGPAWLSTTWQRGQALVTDALVTLGRVSAFASSRRAFVITVRAPVADVQVGRVAGITTGRISYGPLPPNPFSVPQVP
jgi:hypothetical protein